MLPLTLLTWPEVFRRRTVVWYVDNTSALASFVRGASANESLEKMAALLLDVFLPFGHARLA